jgi:hypothetical protein
MRSVDLETAIADFLEMGRRLQASSSLSGQHILDELAAWYGDLRVEGAAVDEDGDMLLLQWGAIAPIVVSEPTDLRFLDDEDLKFATNEVKYLDFTRQVFVGSDEHEDEVEEGDEDGDNDEGEFDDAAVQMSITLGFDGADGTEPIDNLWITSPDEVARGTKKFCNTKFVKSLLELLPKSVAITVGYCG